MYNREKLYDGADETAKVMEGTQEGTYEGTQESTPVDAQEYEHDTTTEGTQECEHDDTQGHEHSNTLEGTRGMTCSYADYTARIRGVVAQPFAYDHTVFGEKFYTTRVMVMRTSGVYDYVPILISERLVNVQEDMSGTAVEVLGQIRSYNAKTEEKRHLIINVFAKEWTPVEGEFLEERDSVNEVAFMGYVCKPPIYRVTPHGREITDILLAVNLSYGKSSYIPCITWGRNARYTATFAVGRLINVVGRFQSRDYEKVLPDGTKEIRTAVEVSINRLIA